MPNSPRKQYARPRAASRAAKSLPTVAAWQEAVSFAAHAHRHQFRKDATTPYASHVFRVALTVALVFECDDPVAINAAILHDTIEDTTTDYEDLARRFGTEVADCVAALTKNMALPESVREDEYDARLAQADWRARLVKLADTYDNLCDLMTWPEARRAAKRAEGRKKCVRALTLAEPDAERVPAIARAIARVQELLAAQGKSGGGR